ncbi:MAG: hypothetical protein IJ985_02460, partial [Akkermansia sp.]|nr:hypothetical protein [Akkermansia sp.]
MEAAANFAPLFTVSFASRSKPAPSRKRITPLETRNSPLVVCTVLEKQNSFEASDGAHSNPAAPLKRPRKSAWAGTEPVRCRTHGFSPGGLRGDDLVQTLLVPDVRLVELDGASRDLADA